MKGDERFKWVLENSYARNLNAEVLIQAEVCECHLP